jgi:iron complex outermembrane receptor protein
MRTKPSCGSGGALLSALTAALTIGAVQAQNSPEQASKAPQLLSEVVVTATRSPRSEDTIPASITVLRAADIEKTSAQTVSDILRFQAGVQVSDLLGTKRSPSVDLRGFGETAVNNTLVLVNGRRLNSSDIGEVDWTTIPLERVERLEIVRGGASVLYGDKAVGGVINIVTKKGGDQPRITSDTAFGSFNAFRQALSSSGSLGPVSYGLNSSYASTDGYRDNSYLRNKTLGLDLGYHSAAPFSLDTSFGIKEDRYGMPGAVSQTAKRTSTLTPRDYGETQAAYFQATPRLKINDDLKLELGLNYSDTEYGYFFSPGYRNRWKVSEFGIQPNFDFSWNSGDAISHKTKIGLDYNRLKRSPLANGDVYGNEFFRDDVAFYVNNSTELVSKRLFLDLGYRRAAVKYDLNSPADRTFSLNMFRSGLTYLYADGSKMFVSADRSFRTHLLSGEFSPTILPPQTSWQFQAGLKHSFGRLFSASATGFQINTNDEIFYDPKPGQPGGFGRNLNYPKTRRQGVELSVESDPVESLHLSTSYTLMAPTLGGGAYQGKRIPMVATHNFQSGATWSPLKELDIDLRARWLSGRYALSDWANAQPNWEGAQFFVADAKVVLRPVPALKLYVGVNNIFDRAYSDAGWAGGGNPALLYPSPKRNFIGGFSWTMDF